MLSSRERKILFLTAGVVLLGLLYHFLIEPFFTKWQDVSKEIQTAEVRLQKTRLLLRKRSEIEKRFQRYAGALEKVEGSGGGITAVLQEVEALAQKSRLKVLGMRPLPKRQKEFFQEQGLEVNAQGTAPQFARFIYDLLGSPNALKIEKLELSSTSGKTPLLKAFIVVTTLTQ